MNSSPDNQYLSCEQKEKIDKICTDCHMPYPLYNIHIPWLFIKGWEAHNFFDIQ